jgi:hypothetical protein
MMDYISQSKQGNDAEQYSALQKLTYLSQII